MDSKRGRRQEHTHKERQCFHAIPDVSINCAWASFFCRVLLCLVLCAGRGTCVARQEMHNWPYKCEQTHVCMCVRLRNGKKVIWAEQLLLSVPLSEMLRRSSFTLGSEITGQQESFATVETSFAHGVVTWHPAKHHYCYCLHLRITLGRLDTEEGHLPSGFV